MSKAVAKAPALWKNSFVWFGVVLAGLSVWGFIKGDEVIRDPGQVRENNLAWFYLAGAVIMLVNGWMTHRQAIRAYDDQSASSTKE